MSFRSQCQHCGIEIRSDLIDGLCPKCVVRMALHADLGPSPNEQAECSSENMSADEAFAFPQKDSSIRRFGDYELLEEIARGGMGVVYRARQRSLNRIVAVKMLLFPKFAGPDAIARFRVEAEAAAKLQHPHIVAIHEIGEEDGQPYFSMDYIEGPNLEQLARNKSLDPKRAAAYVQAIAQAVQYAHEHGIVHRDLKPSNVLIGSSNLPRITDFGLAKVLTSDSQLTMTGQVLGSPAYIPPEQTEGNESKVGKQADVYALGAVLYYLITRRPPFEGEVLTEILDQVRHAEPVAPRLLDRSVPQDLETICLKCLRKEPESRYPSAQRLADDLGRFLSHEPIQARPVSKTDRLWSWCRRKPALASVGAVAVVLLLTLAIGGPLSAARYRMLAEERLRLLYAQDMNAAQQAIETANMGRAVAYLERHRPTNSQPDLREFTWHYLERLCRPYRNTNVLDHEIWVVKLAVTRDGKRLAASEPTGRISIWDPESRSLLHQFLTGEELLTGPITFSPDGHFLAATGHGEGISRIGLQIWDLTNIKHPEGVYTNQDLAGFAAEFSPDGSLLAVPATERVALLEIGQHPTEIRHFRDIRESVRMARFSPDGDRLVTAGWKTDAIVWRVADGTKLGVFTNHTRTVHAAVFSPDGREIASVGDDDVVRWWNASTLQELDSYYHDVAPGALDFSADAWLVASGGNDGLVKLWDIRAGTVRTLRGHSKSVRAVKFIPGASILASGSTDHTVRLWDLNEREPIDILEGRLKVTSGSMAVHCPVAFSPLKSGLIVTLSSDGKDILLWDAASGTVRTRLVHVMPDLRTLFSAEEAAQAAPANRDKFGVVDDLAFSSKGALAAVRSYELNLNGREATRYRIEFWGFQRGVLTKSFEGHSPICFSGDGRVFAWQGTEEGTIYWRDLETGQIGNARQKVFLQGLGQTGLALSSNGAALAVNGWTTMLWDTATGEVLAALSAEDDKHGPLSHIEFSPDDGLLVAGGESGEKEK